MTEEERLDLSLLDPRDPEHWQRVMADTLGRVDAVLSRRVQDPFTAIAGWKRPLLIAAGFALALLIPVEFALEARESEAERVERLVSMSADRGDAEPPSGADFLRALYAAERP